MSIIVTISLCIGSNVCKSPNISVNGTCCSDINSNGICDFDETTSTTSTTTTSTTTSISTTSTTTTTIEKECYSHSDCGEDYYYENYLCGKNNVIRIKYVPRCINGRCVTKSKTEVIDVCKIDERCVPGKERCLSKLENRLPVRAILINISKEEFAGGYRDVQFKLLNITTRPFSNEILKAIIEVKFVTNKTTQTVECSWDYSGKVSDIEIGLFTEKIIKNNESITIWVR
ncbi:MAG TPA: hypothetical protein EYP86_01385 [Candidatus Altiarchaeales archaeon]|nr:hypothetical protein [Candidatus Altiarchaeales archaeon]